MPKPGQITNTDPEPNADPPLSSLQEDDLWKAKSITLYWSDSSPTKDIPVLIYGSMVIYEHGLLSNYPGNKRQYGLRWNCSTYIILGLDDLAGLKKVGEELFDSFPLVWKEVEAKEVVAKLPEWVRPWIEAMSEDNQYYDPTALKGE